MRILVVDDNQDAAETLGVLLQVWGHEVGLAHDGVQALAVAARFQPDVVLLELGLPRLDGCQVARRLRELPGVGQARLIAVTGYCHEEDRRRSREAGMELHLVKPVDFVMLRQLLDGYALATP